jgi:hypothetical protein
MGVAHDYEPDFLVRLDVPGPDLTPGLEVNRLTVAHPAT